MPQSREDTRNTKLTRPLAVIEPARRSQPYSARVQETSPALWSHNSLAKTWPRSRYFLTCCPASCHHKSFWTCLHRTVRGRSRCLRGLVYKNYGQSRLFFESVCSLNEDLRHDFRSSLWIWEPASEVAKHASIACLAKECRISSVAGTTTPVKVP